MPRELIRRDHVAASGSARHLEGRHRQGIRKSRDRIQPPLLSRQREAGGGLDAIAQQRQAPKNTTESTMTPLSEKLSTRWKDAANLVLGVWLAASPWAIGYVGNQYAAWNAWIVGCVIAVAALAALVTFQKWEEWINTALGLWLVISPFLLSYMTITSAAWNQIVIGALVSVLSVWTAVTTEEGHTATRS